jgi:Spy/CpxP family protein refolding chaperone
MNVRLKIPRGLFAALSLAVVLAGGLAAAYAEDTGGSHRGMHGAMKHHAAQSGGTHGGRHGRGHEGGAEHRSHGKHHGKGHAGHHGKKHAGHHLFGDHWKKTLTDEQKARLDRLHLEFAKKKHVLKSGIEALKVQLAVHAIADEPQPAAIDAQINELLMAKRQLMQAKYSYIAAQRQVLTPEQRVSFDMGVIHKAAGGGKKKGHGGGKH